MLFLGVLLLMATGSFALLLIADNHGGTPEYTVTLFDQDIATMSTTAVFMAGIALALLFALAFWMCVSGGGRSRRRRAALRTARAEARDAAAERDALRDQLDTAPVHGDDTVEPVYPPPAAADEPVAPASSSARGGTATAASTKQSSRSDRVKYRMRHLFNH
ncbi:hypothetical protein [Yinghuangia soli]|uniref:Lipopolysaccharide assembly protein A domain-containing protein n=1 Tax=Yinghuangia soli TaxID=2908204 RepID=A0AA41Q5P1_9ACTN|nr:hypothetical protein [Yinghuangia soli]MCF2532038.1 hypothetical protein [Yinghuangia soli]